ncbi:MAG: HNH endonuclease [Ferrovum sp.]|nr:HNH endonuclease [Ferrovum sp.]
MAYNRLSLEEKIAAKTRHEGDCIVWTGHISAKGYGRIRLKGKYRFAHRVVYEMHRGPIPDGLLVMHSCDNPPCVNIKHLSLGTQLDNVRDMQNKGRAVILRGATHPSIKLSTEQIEAIKSRYRPHDKQNGGPALGREFGVHQKTILAIIHGKHWSGPAESVKRKSVLTFNGVTKNVPAWAASIGISANALYARLRLGWSVERALTEKLQDHSARGRKK